MFAHLCDKLDFDLQMKLYTDQGYINLDKNNTSPVFTFVRTVPADLLTSSKEIYYYLLYIF